MATKLGRIVAYHEGLPNHKVTQRPGHVVFKLTWQTKMLYSHNQSAYGYKLGRIMTYLDEFLPIKSYQSLIKKSYKITQQTATIISPLQHCL